MRTENSQSYSQAAEKEHHHHTELPTRRHLQSQNSRYRQRKDDSIESHIEGLHYLYRYENLDAMSWFANLPGLSHWRALKCKDQVVRKKPYQDKTTNYTDPFSQLTNREDSSVEEQN